MGKIDIEYDFGLGYTIMIYFNDRSEAVLDFTGYGYHLLQALWQVANEIVREVN